MYFANAPREIWALGCRYSALLNNMMVTRYNQGSKKAIIPLLANDFIIKCGNHVDDFLFSTNNWEQFNAWVDRVNKDISFSRFDSVDKGADYMSLWLTYDRVKNYLQISQSAYIKKALRCSTWSI